MFRINKCKAHDISDSKYRCWLLSLHYVMSSLWSGSANSTAMHILYYTLEQFQINAKSLWHIIQYYVDFASCVEFDFSTVKHSEISFCCLFADLLLPTNPHTAQDPTGGPCLPLRPREYLTLRECSMMLVTTVSIPISASLNIPAYFKTQYRAM